MRIGSLFSGVGGLELGLEWAGVGCTAWQVEINPFCRQVLAKHWPHVERFEDVRSVGKHNLSPVDLICGGFPCQDVSSAGKRRGLAGERSGLWYEYRRVVSELRPRLVLVENVDSGRAQWLPFVRADLEALGYGTRAFLLSAEDVGLPNRRKRIFVLGQMADAGDDGREVGGSTHDADGRDARRYESHRRDPSVGVPPGPMGWTDEATAHYQPAFLGGSPRIPNRVDQFVAIGNAVSPLCAEAIGNVILTISNHLVNYSQ